MLMMKQSSIPFFNLIFLKVDIDPFVILFLTLMLSLVIKGLPEWSFSSDVGIRITGEEDYPENQACLCIFFLKHGVLNWMP